MTPPSGPRSQRPAIGATRAAPVPSPEPSLRAARAVLARPEALAGPGWARSVVLLTRQALEDAVTAFWARRAPGMEQAAGKSRLVALRYYVDDPALAPQAHHIWCTLSEAAHHHGYDLAPTAAELRGWLDATQTIVDRLDAGSPRSTAGS
jgi:hypothetical protein